MHSLHAFKNILKNGEIILVLPGGQMELWKSLCREYAFDLDHRLVEGGSERYYSVRNGLDAVSPEAELVAIHDGVRPLVTHEVIDRALDAARAFGSGIPVVGVADSVRWVENEGSRVLDRDQLRLVQTPQCFRMELIRGAYDAPFSASFTDDATVVEGIGHRVHLTEGDTKNMKITRPEDLKLAEFLGDHLNS